MFVLFAERRMGRNRVPGIHSFWPVIIIAETEIESIIWSVKLLWGKEASVVFDIPGIMCGIVLEKFTSPHSASWNACVAGHSRMAHAEDDGQECEFQPVGANSIRIVQCPIVLGLQEYKLRCFTWNFL